MTIFGRYLRAVSEANDDPLRVGGRAHDDGALTAVEVSRAAEPIHVAAQVTIESKVRMLFIRVQLQALEQGAVNPGSTWGQPGVILWSTCGQPGVDLGSTWGHPGVNLGSTWGQPAPPYHLTPVTPVTP